MSSSQDRHGPYGDVIRRQDAAYQRAKAKAIREGTWQPARVDPEPARVHVEKLRRMGLSTRSIADAAGMGLYVINKLVWPMNGPGKGRLHRRSEAAILAVTPGSALDKVPDGAFISAVGSRRRIEALACLGYGIEDLVQASGLHRNTVWSAVRSETVSGATARAIRGAYDALYHTDKPNADPRVINRARRRKFVPPVRWDDDAIDDPAAKPLRVRPETTAPRINVTEVISKLRSGESLVAIAAAIGPEGVHPQSIEQAAERLRRRTGDSTALDLIRAAMTPADRRPRAPRTSTPRRRRRNRTARAAAA